MAQNFLSDIKLGDNIFIRLGDATNGDLQVFHDGNSVIRNQTGNLFIDNYQDDGDIIFRSDDGTGSQTQYLTIDGSDVMMKAHKKLRFLDNVHLTLGNSDDLKVFHDGTDTVIQNETGDLELQNRQDDGDIKFKSDDGSGGVAEYFRLDGGNTRTEFVKNIKLYDSVKALFGTGNDLEIYHDGSHSYIQDAGTGELRLSANIFRVLNANASETMIYAEQDGKVQLRFNESTKFETSNTGINVTGNVLATGQVLCDTNTTTPTGGEAVFYKSSAGAVLSGFQAILETGSAGSRQTALTINNSQNATFEGDVSIAEKLIHSGDTNTYLQFPSSNDKIVFATNGSDVLTLDAANAATFTGNINSFGTTNTYSSVLGRHPVHTSYGGLWNTKGQANETSRYMILNAADADGYRTYINGDELYLRAGVNSTTGQVVVRTTGTTFAGQVNVAETLKIGGATSGTKTLIFESTTNAQNYNIDFYSNANAVQGRINYAEGPGSINLLPNSSATAALSLAYDGSATFAGDITTTGDLTASQLTIDDYIYHAGDTNTYIYFTPDNIKLRAGGDDRLELATTYAKFSNSVGIGVTPSDTTALTAKGTTNLSSRITLIKDLTTDKVLKLGADRDTTARPFIGSTSAHGFDIISADAPAITLDTSQNANFANVALFNDNKGINFGNSNAKIYGSSADGIKFNAGGSEAMRLNQSGDLGIGTASPDGQLHVKGTTNKTLKLDPTFSSGTYTTLAFARSGLDKWRVFHPSDDSYLSFYNENITAHQFTLASSGKVGIGQINPTTAKLVVTGEQNTYTLRLDANATTGQSYGARIRAGTNGDDKALLVENTSASELFSIKGDATATFAGDVSLTSGHELTVNNAANNNNGGIHIKNDNNLYSGALTFHTEYSGTDTHAARVQAGTNGTDAILYLQVANTSKVLTTAVSFDHLNNQTKATFVGQVKAPFFTSDGGRGFKQDSVAFVGTFSNGADANTANDIGKTANKWRDAYFSGQVNSATIDTTGNATFGGKVDIRGSGYHQIHIAHTTSADTNKQSGITTSNYEGNNVSIFQTFQQNNNNTIYFGSADGSHRGLQNYRFYVNTDSDAVSGHTEALHIGSDKTATFKGNVLIPSGYVGRDEHNRINFDTDDSIIFRLADSYRARFDSDGFKPYADSSYDLGSSSLYWKDAYIDAITTTGNVTVGGNLTVNGTTTTVNQTNLDVSDNIIGLNRGLTGTNANDSGIIIERGSSGDNAAFIWDESIGYFSFGTTQKTPSATGAVANESDWSWKPIKASGAIFTGDITVEGGILYLGKADTASGHINSKELMTFNIDTDNDDTNRYFGFYKDGESGSGTELLKISEDGTTTFTSGNFTIQSGTSHKPYVTIKNTTNDNQAGVLYFEKDRQGAAGVDGDDIGLIQWKAGNSAQQQTTFAQILVEAAEVNDTDEAAHMQLRVAASDGSSSGLENGLRLTGHPTSAYVDVELGHGTNSTATFAGKVTTGGTLTIPTGSYNEIVFTGSGGTKILAPVEMYLEAANDIYLMSHGSVNLTLGNDTATFAGDVTAGALTSGETAQLVINHEGGASAVAKFMSRTNRAFIQVGDNDTNGYIVAEGGLLSIGRAASASDNNININASHQVMMGANTTSFSDKLYVHGDGYTTGAWRVGTAATYVGKLFNDSGKLTLQSDGDRDIQIGSSNNADVVVIDTSAKSTTFSGNVTLSSTGPLLHLANTTSTTGKTWRFSSAANGNLFITQEGVIDAVTLNHTTGNAIFAGDIIANGNTRAIRITNGAGTPATAIQLLSDSSGDGQLRINDSGGTTKIFFYGEANNNNYINNGGNLGVGTASPSGTGWDEAAQVLHVYKNSTNGALLALESSNTKGILAAGNNKLSLFTTTDDELRIGTSGTIALSIDTSQIPTFQNATASGTAMYIHNTTNQDTDTKTLIDFRAHASDNSTFYVAGQMGSKAEGTWTSTSGTRDASLIFNTVLNGNNELALTLASDKLATFNGGIVQSMANPFTKMIDTSAGGDTYGLNNNQSKFSIYNWTDGREELYFGGDGNAVFTGNVTVDGGQILTPSGVNLALNPNTGVVSVGGAITTTSTISAGSTIHRGNMTIDSQEIDIGSGNFTLDCAGQINIDSGNAEIHLKGSGNTFGKLFTSGGNFFINHPVADKEIFFTGLDGSNNINALILDMANAGNATFASNISTAADKRIAIGTWDNSAFTGGAAHGYYVSAGTPILILEESDQSKTGYVGVSGGNMFVGGIVSSLKFQTNNGSTQAMIDSSGRFFVGHESVLLSSSEKFSVSAGTNGINVFSSSGTGNGTLYLQNTNNSTTDWQTYLIFQDGVGNRAQFGNFYNDSKLGISGHGGIAFKTGATSLASATTRLTITSSGLSEFEGDVKISKSTPVLTFNNLAGGGLDPSLTATGSNFTISTTSITPFSLALDDGTLTLDPGQAGKKPLKLVGNYSSNGDVKILEFVRSGDAVAGAIEYNDATTDMEIGTVTNHAFSIKTNDIRALTINNSQNANFTGNLGIGTNNPTYKLQVQGTFYVNETAYINGNTEVNANLNVTAGSVSISADGSNAATLTESSAGILTIATVDDFKIDAGGDISLDAEGADIRFKDGTTHFGTITNASSHLVLQAATADKDIIFKGTDGSTEIDALRLDMSNAGSATFNDDVDIGKNLNMISASSPTIQVKDTTNDCKLLIYSQDNSSIIGTYSNHPLAFFTNSAQRITITNGGNVGVGSTTPSHKLQVFDSTSDAPLMIESGDGFVGMKFKDPDDNDNLYYRGDIESFYFTGARLGINNSSPQYNLSVLSSDTVSYAHFINSSTGNSANDGANVGVNGLDFYIWQRENASVIIGTNGSERARVTGAGDVGIGTVSPGAKLNVFTGGNSIAAAAVLQHDTFGADRKVGLGFELGNTQIKGAVGFISDGSSVGNNGRGNLIFCVDSNDDAAPVGHADEKMRITHGGNVGIGTASPSSKLHVSGTNTVGRFTSSSSYVDLVFENSSGTGGFLNFNQTSSFNLYIGGGSGSNLKMSVSNAGTLTVSGDVVAFGSPSDASLKENVKPIDNALDKVSKLKGVTFDWKESDSILDIKEDIGFVAQDVQEVLPELVRENDNGKLSLRDKGIIPVLVEAIKDLKAEVEDLKKQLNK